MPRRPAISLSAPAISSACSRLSSAHGPAMSASGSALPKPAAPTATIELGPGSTLSMAFAVLVPRTRSSHHNCRESDCELRVQSGTRIIELLVSFDSEVRFGACGKPRRTSESGHEGGHLMNRYYALTIGAAMIFSALPLLGTPVLAADPRVADL